MARIKSAYSRLSSRYGSRWAKVILAVGLLALPIPLPGSSLVAAAPVLAVAELCRFCP